MLDLGTLKIGVKADTDSAKKGLKDVQTEVDSTAKKSESGTSKIKAAFGDMGKKIAQAAKVGAIAASASMVAIGVSATKAYADYEQLKGGVEKLFGSSAKTLMKYAEQAYKTTGLSANQYMEQATSFSASLIKSCAGDTQKAAQLTDVAMRDMADNVNTFGTSMQDVQHAYQGFAKENYTMLDNLKLGYAGTKEGMQQLLAEAERLTGKHFELGNFADMTEAIHAVQEEMKITGTTATEAEQTISGSFNMMKASWDNFLVALGSGNETQIQQAIQNLVDTAGQFLANAAPVFISSVGTLIGTVILNLPSILATAFTMLPGIIKQAWDTVLTGLQLNLPEESFSGFSNALQKIQEVLDPIIAPLRDEFIPVVEAVKDTLTSIGETIGSGLLTVLEALQPYLTDISEVFGVVLYAALEIAKQAFEGISSVVQELSPVFDAIAAALNALHPVFQAVANVVKSVFATAFSIAVSIIQPAMQTIRGVIQTVVGVIQTIIGVFVGIFTGNWQQAADGAKKIVDGMKTALTGIFNTIKTVLSQIFEKIISKVISWATNMASNAKKAGTDFLNHITTFFTQLPGKVWNFLSQTISKALQFATDMGKKGLEAGKNLLTNVVNALKNAPSKMLSIGTDMIKGMINGIKQMAHKVVDAAKKVVDDAVKGAKALLGIHSPSRVFREIGKYTMEGFEIGIEKKTKSVVRTMKNATAAATNAFNPDLSLNNTDLMGNYTAFKTQKQILMQNDNPGYLMGNNQNITVNNYSPKALNEAESARQFKMTMRDLALSM